MKLTPYQRIVRNAAQGRGVRLSVVETQGLALDAAIWQLAQHDDDADHLKGDAPTEGDE